MFFCLKMLAITQRGELAHLNMSSLSNNDFALLGILYKYVNVLFYSSVVQLETTAAILCVLNVRNRRLF